MEITGLSPEDLYLHYMSLSPNAQRELEKLLNDEITTNGVPDRYTSWLPTALPPSWDAHAPHIELIGSYLDQVTQKRIDRLAIHMPPRHAKCICKYSNVNMCDGSYKLAMDIRAGDRLLSLDPRTKSLCARTVTNAESNGVTLIYNIYTTGGRSIKCTGNHPLYVPEGAWMFAENVLLGQRIGVINSKGNLTWDFVTCVRISSPEETIAITVDGETYDDCNYITDGIVSSPSRA